MSDEVILRVGDQNPPLSFTLIEATGVAKDLTGCTVVYNQAPDVGGDLQVECAQVTIVTAASGIVLLDWPAEATEVSGNFFGEFVATVTATGKTSTYPPARRFVVRVLDALTVD